MSIESGAKGRIHAVGIGRNVGPLEHCVSLPPIVFTLACNG